MVNFVNRSPVYLALTVERALTKRLLLSFFVLDHYIIARLSDDEFYMVLSLRQPRESNQHILWHRRPSCSSPAAISRDQ